MLDTPEFTILKENSPWHADDQWHMEKVGKGFALQVSLSQVFWPHDVFGKSLHTRLALASSEY